MQIMLSHQLVTEASKSQVDIQYTKTRALNPPPKLLVHWYVGLGEHVNCCKPIGMGSNLGPEMTQALVDEGCCHLCLGLSNICLTEEELSIEVGDINGVHVDDMDILGLVMAFW